MSIQPSKFISVTSVDHSYLDKVLINVNRISYILPESCSVCIEGRIITLTKESMSSLVRCIGEDNRWLIY